MEIIEQHQTILLVMALVFGLYMTWGIGANDVANAMGTSVGSGAISLKQAIANWQQSSMALRESMDGLFEVLEDARVMGGGK